MRFTLIAPPLHIMGSDDPWALDHYWWRDDEGWTYTCDKKYFWAVGFPINREGLT